MLVTSKQMILDAKRGGYAIGCFNTSDIEITKAIIMAAVALKSPVIISTSEKAISYAGLEALAAAIKAEAESASVPVALHLDHGASIETVDKCLNVGYTSIMIDGSKRDFNENIAITFEAALHAHTNEIPCEGELGAMGKAGLTESKLTDAEEVTEFVKKTDVDFLAISLGTKHGSGTDSSDTEKIDFDLLRKIRGFTDVPLVLHGGSGVPEADIKKLIQNGISKINIDTDIRNEFTLELREALKDAPNQKDPREIMQKAIDGVRRLVENKIKMFGSNNKC